MGVNMAGKCIYDDEAVQDAARQEITRRYYDACASAARAEAPTTRFIGWSC